MINLMIFYSKNEINLFSKWNVEIKSLIVCINLIKYFQKITEF